MNYYLYLDNKLNDLDNYFDYFLIRDIGFENKGWESCKIVDDLEINSIEDLPNIHVKDGQIYEYGGIYDIIDKAVFGDHYSTSHYIAYCSINLDENYTRHINNIETSIPFLAKTNINYIYGNWTPHRDFNNLANIIIYRNTKNYIRQNLRDLLKDSIINTRVNLRNRATNWILMRCLFYQLRYLEFNNYLDYIKYKFTLREAINRQLSDGCIEDKKGKSDPIQYHVYSLILFMKIYQLDKNSNLKKIIELGLEYFISFFNFDGNFNYKGRGQQQIFGYAAGLYALLYALNNDLSINVLKYEDALISLLNYLKKYLNMKQVPLTFNEYSSENKIGWYDYHHYTVYLAFFMLWTKISMQEFGDTLRKININLTSTGRKEKLNYFKKYNQSEVYIYKNEHYFMSISGKKGKYLSDFGFSFDNLNINNYGDLITCPGGPSLKKYGKLNIMKNVEFNFFTPIITMNNSHYNPIIESKSITLDDCSESNNIQLTLKSKLVDIKRFIKLYENKIIVIDEITKKNTDNELQIYLNMPLVEGNWKSNNDMIFNEAISIKFKFNDCEINCSIKDKMFNAAGQVNLVATALQKFDNNVKFITSISIES